MCTHEEERRKVLKDFVVFEGIWSLLKNSKKKRPWFLRMNDSQDFKNCLFFSAFGYYKKLVCCKGYARQR